MRPSRKSPTALVTLATLATLAACGDSGASGGAAAAAPARAGQVWEVDGADRAAAPAALLAYVTGFHVMVLDGSRAFTGMTRLEGQRGAEGTAAFTLANGLSAELKPAGDGMELRFSNGQAVPMRRQAPRPAPR